MVAAAAASPSPSPALRAAAAAGRPHPTYTKMITQALAELGGASPRAGIAGYILGRGYSGLPARHDDLLSAHLRRLLAEGVLLRLDADSPSPTYILAPPEEQKRGPGRPPRNKAGDATAPAAAAPAVKLGEKRGPGRPRKNPAPAPAQASSSSLDKPAHTGIAAHSAAPQPANRKRGLSPTASPGNDDDHDSVVTTKRGRQQGPEAFQNGGHEAGAFPIQNGGTGHVHVQSSGGLGGIKRGCGRPWKDKPPSSPAAAMSPASGNNAASSTTAGVKRGRGRPRKEKPPTPAAASRGFKRGCGRPSPSVSAATSYGKGAVRKEWPPAGAKRGRGRPRKDQCVGGGLVGGAYEVFFRQMMTEASAGQEEEEDLVLSGEKMPQTEEGVAPGDGRDTRAAADAGCVPVSGQAAATSAPVGAVDSDHLGPADDVVSTAGVKRGRGRPRKIKPAAAAAAMPAETGDDDASVVIEPQGGTPRMEESAAAARSLETTRDAAAPTGVKRPRGRPRKNPPSAAMSAETRDAAASTGGVKRGRGRPPKKKPAAAMSAETGDAASTGVKRGRGRPRKEKPAAAAATGVAGVKRGCGRPMRAGSVGTWYAESAAERELFRHMAEEEAPGDREDARAADDAGRVPVSGENVAAAPVEAGNGSDFGPTSL